MIRVENAGAVRVLWLDRPEVHNAFDAQTIEALIVEIDAAERDPEVRVLVLRGAGRSFCAGGDLGYLRDSVGFSRGDNLRDARRLGYLFARLDALKKPTVAVVEGAAFGGGAALVLCCDVVIASPAARFALSEVRLGLVGAVIAPFVLRALGERTARRLILTGEAFDAGAAQYFGVVHDLVEAEEIDGVLQERLTMLLRGAPGAQAGVKALLSRLRGAPIDRALLDEMAQQFAEVRIGEEAQEGIDAFLGKRAPNWDRSAAIMDADANNL